MDFLVAREEFISEIQKLEQSGQKKVIVYNQIISFCREILEEYRKCMQASIFEDSSSEIMFFKEQKQLPLTYLIYYVHLLSYETGLPVLDDGLRRKFIINRVQDINDFFVYNIEFLQYMELGQDYLDEFYFTRKNYSKKYSSGTNYDRDPNFSTSHDLLLGEINAFKLFLSFLELQLTKITNPSADNFGGAGTLRWTSSKVAFTELAYALYHSGVINNGNVSLKELVGHLEKSMGIEVGDYHHTFLKLRERSQPLKFLDKLRNDLFERMQEMDK